MKIVIIGAGAMGGLFAARLAAAGEDVSVVDVWAEHVETIRTQGLILETGEGEVRTKPAAVTRVEDLAACAADLVIVFVKSGMTAAAARSAQTILGPVGRVLTLQNGLGNAEIIAEVFGADRVLAGTTAQGATLIGPGRIRHGGRGDTHIGRLTGPVDDFCREAAMILSRAGIPAIAEDAVQSLIWGKLVINVGINALTALLRFTNGQLNDHAETRELVKLAVAEAVQVAAAAHIPLPYGDAFGCPPAIRQRRRKSFGGGGGDGDQPVFNAAGHSPWPGYGDRRHQWGTGPRRSALGSADAGQCDVNTADQSPGKTAGNLRITMKIDSTAKW